MYKTTASFIIHLVRVLLHIYHIVNAEDGDGRFRCKLRQAEERSAQICATQHSKLKMVLGVPRYLNDLRLAQSRLQDSRSNVVSQDTFCQVKPIQGQVALVRFHLSADVNHVLNDSQTTALCALTKHIRTCAV